MSPAHPRRPLRQRTLGLAARAVVALVGIAGTTVGLASCNLVAGLNNIRYSTSSAGGGCSSGICNGGSPTETAGPGSGGFGGFGGFGTGGLIGTGGIVGVGGASSQAVQSSTSPAAQSSSSGTCECTPGEPSSTACGNCGNGMMSRTCQPDCTWGAYTACSGTLCTSATTSSAECGNCNSGTHTRTCQGDCTWSGYGACNGATGCTPGDTKAGCDTPSSSTCGHEVCKSDCTWSGCEPTNVCLYKSGASFQCCGAGKCQFCDEATCNWYSCQPCTCTSCGC